MRDLVNCTFEQFVKWLGRTKEKFYWSAPSESCPLAVFSGVAVGALVYFPSDQGSPVKLPAWAKGLPNWFDIYEPKTGPEALAILKQAGRLKRQKERPTLHTVKTLKRQVLTKTRRNRHEKPIIL